MPRNLDTSLIRAFVAVADTTGMTAAANILNLTQAAVSQQIKRLEEIFGHPLFERDRRGLRLTHPGERLLAKARRMLAVNDEIWAEMTTEVYAGQVRLGIPYDVVNAYLPRIMKSFAQAHPQVEITLTCRSSAELREALARGELDLTLTTELGGGPDSEVLASERLIWVGARGGEAYLRRPLPVCFGSEACAFRVPIMQALREADIGWRPVSEISNMDAMNATVQMDLAVMGLLAPTVSAGFQVLGPDSRLPSLPMFSVNLYLPSSGSDPNAHELARHIRESFIGAQRQSA